MPTLEQDWSFLRAAVEELDDYILSPELYWPLTSKGREQLPPLSPGNLLLSRARLTSFAWASSRQGELSTILNLIGHSLVRWNANWERKAGREYIERLRLWQNFIEDLADDPAKNKKSYPQQVRWRVILYLLDDEFRIAASHPTEPLQAADHRLRLLSHTGGFVWEEGIKNAFPPDKCWFLYVVL